jgi:hypothetical protein
MSDDVKACVRARRRVVSAVVILVLAGTGAALSLPGHHDEALPVPPVRSPSAQVPRVAVQWSVRSTPDASWTQTALVRYGPAPTQLGLEGTEPLCPPTCGPDSAAPAPDGTWWVLDTAKRRFAHLSRRGAFLGQVPLPAGVPVPEHLEALADGTLLALSGDRLVRLDLGTVTVLPLTGVTSSTPRLLYVLGSDAWLAADDGSQRFAHLDLDGDGAGASFATTGPAVSPVTVTSHPERLEVRFTGSEHPVDLTFGPDDAVTWQLAPAGDTAEAGTYVLLRATAGRSALVLVRPDGRVTQQSGFDQYPARSTAGPSLREAQGALLLALPERDGLHLYERLGGDEAPLPPASGVRADGVQEPSSVDAAACESPPGAVVELVVTGPDGVPQPRCSQVRRDQRLRLSNRSWTPVAARVGRYAYRLGPGESRDVPGPVSGYLADGAHAIALSAGATGPVVVVTDAPFDLGVFQDEEAPFSRLDLRATGRWGGRVGQEYDVLYVGADGRHPRNGRATLLRYRLDATFLAAQQVAVPAGEGALNVLFEQGGLLRLRSSGGSAHTYDEVARKIR